MEYCLFYFYIEHFVYCVFIYTEYKFSFCFFYFLYGIFFFYFVFILLALFKLTGLFIKSTKNFSGDVGRNNIFRFAFVKKFSTTHNIFQNKTIMILFIILQGRSCSEYEYNVKSIIDFLKCLSALCFCSQTSSVKPSQYH